MKKIILLLGSPNDDNGQLSQIAKDRNKCAFNIYNSNNEIRLLCTGGCGEHFNRTDIPHAQYSKNYLISKGVNEKDFLPFILSSNTYEDLEISKPIIEKENPDLLIIITSDFHMERVKLLCEKLLDYTAVLFVPAKSSLTPAELESYIQHEKLAIRKIKENLY